MKAPPARVWLLTAGGFALYGGIAAFVNRAHGIDTAARAGLIQGISSAIATFITSVTIDAAHAAWTRRFGLSWKSLGVAALAGVFPPTLQHITLHVIAGTPELWATIAVPASAALVYATIYATVAQRRARNLLNLRGN